jgi:predicted phage terminase large subunit-like protein
MLDEQHIVICKHCKTPNPITEFRCIVDKPPARFIDFCTVCEAKHGLPALVAQHMDSWPPAVRKIYKALDAAPEVKRAETSRTEMIARERARRELCRRKLIYYTSQFYLNYVADWVHQDVCRRLELFVKQVERGESPRLILNLPPRHGKSLLASDHFVSWALGTHPEWEIISTSYAASLPIGFSRKIRDRIRSAEHQAIFPEAKLRSDATGVEEWQLTAGGRYRAAGVGGGITGTGAHILIVDDPYADDEAAQSETQRAKVIDWFNTTAYSRLAPGAGVLIIHTRWHDADLSGAMMLDKKDLLEQGATLDEIDNWELVTYPAIAEDDEWLAVDGSIHRGDEPEGGRLLRKKGEALTSRYDLNKLNRIKNRLTKSQWNALYQQNPVPDDGDYFTKDDFRFYHTLPGTLDEYTYFCAWDFAIELKKKNDWTVGLCGAMNTRGDVYVVDMFRARVGTYGIVTAIADMVEKWEVSHLGMEDGQIKKTLMPLVEDELRARLLSPSVDDELVPLTDKLVRARPLQGMMQRGRVYFPLAHVSPWSDRLYNEFIRFPYGVHDDIVDAGAWLLRMAQRIPPPQFGPRRRKKPDESWRARLGRELGTDKSFMAA